MLAKGVTLAIIAEINSGELVGVLRTFGFEPYTYEPFTRTLAPHQHAIGGNGIFVRNVNAVRERLNSAPSFSVAGFRI